MAAWGLAGLLLILVDERVQPTLAELGRSPLVRAYAVCWQLTGSLLGVAFFLMVGLAVSLRQRDRTILRFGFTAALAMGAAEALKHLVGRARPDMVNHQSHFFGPWGAFNAGPPVEMNAMPSGHATMAFAMAMALAWRWPRLKTVWFGIAVGVGLARLLMDRHFPSDVVLGALLGTLSGMAVASWSLPARAGCAPEAPAPMGEPASLSVIMPVHNESPTLRAIIGKVLAATDLLKIELIIVDDGSTDDSRAIIRELAARHPNVRGCFQDRNQGKGAAVRQGIALATGQWILIQDADLEYDPADYGRLLEPALAGRADAVFGSRFAAGGGGGGGGRALPFWQRLANRVLTGLANLLTGLGLTDMETGYKLVRAELLKRLPLVSRSFTIEPELTVRLARCGARVAEVPVSYRGRTRAEGKHTRGRDALAAIWALFYFRFLSR